MNFHGLTIGWEGRLTNSLKDRQTDRQTDRDRQTETDRQIEIKMAKKGERKKRERERERERERVVAWLRPDLWYWWSQYVRLPGGKFGASPV